jgi:hypothetical protein
MGVGGPGWGGWCECGLIVSNLYFKTFLIAIFYFLGNLLLTGLAGGRMYLDFPADPLRHRRAAFPPIPDPDAIGGCVTIPTNIKTKEGGDASLRDKFSARGGARFT